MTDYTELIRSLRNCSNNRCTPCDCGWFNKYQVDESCKEIIMWKAAAAIEALQAEVDALKHDIERYVQMNTELLNDRPELEEIGGKWVWKEPKRGEIVRCGECKYHLPETERTNPYCNRFHCMKPDDWYCADGEREGQG